MRWLVHVVGFSVALTAGWSEQQPSRLQSQVCAVLSVRETECHDRVEWFGPVPELAGKEGLRVLHRTRVAQGEQVVMQDGFRRAMPFLVLLQRSSVVEKAEIPAASLPFVVHAGESATLVQQADGIRLRRRVRCLGRGRIGERVRVQAAGMTKPLVAKVVAPGLLSAEY